MNKITKTKIQLRSIKGKQTNKKALDETKGCFWISEMIKQHFVANGKPQNIIFFLKSHNLENMNMLVGVPRWKTCTLTTLSSASSRKYQHSTATWSSRDILIKGVSGRLAECTREGLLCASAASLVLLITCCARGLCSLGGQENNSHSDVTANFLPSGCAL